MRGGGVEGADAGLEPVAPAQDGLLADLHPGGRQAARDQLGGPVAGPDVLAQRVAHVAGAGLRERLVRAAGRRSASHRRAALRPSREWGTNPCGGATRLSGFAATNASIRSMGPRARTRVGSGTTISPVPRSSASITPGRSFIAIHGQWAQLLQVALLPRRGGLDQGLARGQLAHPVEDAVVGGHDVLAGVALDDRLQELGGRADDVGLGHDARRRLRVDEDRRAGVLRAEELELDALELLVDDAGAVPHQHVGAGLARDVGAEVPVGGPQDLLARVREVAHDRERAGARDHPVGAGLHGGARVGVDDDGAVGVRVAEGGELVGRAAEVERAGRVEVGHQDPLLGAQDLRRLAHEADAGDDERPRRVVAPEAGHLERVGDAAARLEGQVLDVAVDVEVGDEDGVVLGQQGGGARLLLGPLGRRRHEGHARPGPGETLRAVAGGLRVLDLDLAHDPRLVRAR